MNLYRFKQAAIRISPYLVGLLTAVSFSFHIQISQNISLSEKVLFILFITLPVAMVYKLLMENCGTDLNLNSKIIALIVSIGITIVFMILHYKEIAPVRYQELTITNPPTSSGREPESFLITRAEIKNTVTIKLPISEFNIRGKYKYQGKNPIFYPESSLIYKNQFLGDLVLYPTVSGCPLYVTVEINKQKQDLDLCVFATPSGFVIRGMNSGSVSEKWRILIQLMKGFDFIIFSGITYSLLTILWKSIKNPRTISRKDLSLGNTRMVLCILVFSGTVAGMILFIILTTGYLNLYAFIPLLLFDIFLAANLTVPQNKIRDRRLFVLVFLLIGFAWNVVFSPTFFDFRNPFRDPGLIGSNSYNSLVTSKFRGIMNALEFDYKDVLLDRDLKVTKRAFDTHQLVDLEKQGKTLGFTSITLFETSHPLSVKDLNFILNYEHTIWDDQDGHVLIFMDKKNYLPEDSVILDYINDQFIFYPGSILIR